MASRPRGYSEWEPRPDAALVLDQVNVILDAEDEPLTARQIFYRLVARYSYDKTEQAYGRLCENLVKARRAQIIPFYSIRDEKTDELGGDWGYHSINQFWEGLRNSASRYRRPRREEQPVEIELWCEARGMGPSLAKAAQPYGVGVFATGGFPGVTVTESMARRVLDAVDNDQTFVFLHLGDYDPSGEAIYNAMREDVLAFVAGKLGNWADAEEAFTAERIGLTQAQVEEHEFETAPAKRSDKRTPKWEAEGNYGAVQLEAVETDLLREWAREAIIRHTDLERLDQSIEESDEQREKISDGLEKLFETFDQKGE